MQNYLIKLPYQIKAEDTERLKEATKRSFLVVIRQLLQLALMLTLNTTVSEDSVCPHVQ